MATTPDMSVRDIVVSEQPQFTRSNTIETVKRVTYYVGAHGPFTIEGPPDTLTADYIQRRISERVKEIRDITLNPTGGGGAY